MDDPAARTEVERAVDLAWRAIGRRERTVSELRAFLERKRAEPMAIEAAVDELQRAGYLDDAGYARRFAQDKRTLERWGRERIARDLQRRGVAPEHVEAALDGQSRGMELRSALELLKLRFAAPPTEDRERDRAWRVLVRRGYAPELAYEAVREHARGVRGQSRAA
ncbi:MAG: regulatory protein RecX [Thermoleophilaceae bacterium]